MVGCAKTGTTIIPSFLKHAVRSYGIKHVPRDKETEKAIGIRKEGDCVSFDIEGILLYDVPLIGVPNGVYGQYLIILAKTGAGAN